MFTFGMPGPCGFGIRNKVSLAKNKATFVVFFRLKTDELWKAYCYSGLLA